MARLQRRRFSEPDDVRIIPRGRIDVVELGDHVVGRITYDAGWRWSVDMKAMAGTETCQFHHIGVTLSGRLRMQTPDGIELELGPGEVFDIPPGHDAWVVGDEAWVAVDFEAMRTFARSTADAAKRVLSTILFTDIVDSTAQAVARGAAEWRDVVGRHNEIGERIVDRFGGRVVKTTGDGIIALFDSAEGAVRAASALSAGVASLDLAIRAAVHTGEVELTRDDVRGLAVHTAARMMAVAEAGQIVASATVRELLDGSAIEFEDHGLHTLKGLPTERQLYRVRPS